MSVNYARKLEEKEKEIQESAKTNFENRLVELKQSLDVDLTEQESLKRLELQEVWADRVRQLEEECRLNMREDKEQRLIRNMAEKIRPKLEKQLESEERQNVEEKVRVAVKEQVTVELKERKRFELEKARRKLTQITKLKMEEAESAMRAKVDAAFNKRVEQEVASREAKMKEQ